MGDCYYHGEHSGYCRACANLSPDTCKFCDGDGCGNCKGTGLHEQAPGYKEALKEKRNAIQRTN